MLGHDGTHQCVGFPCRDEVERRPTVLSVCRDLGKMTCGYHNNLTIVGRQEPRIKWNYGRFEPFTTGSTIYSLVLDGFSINTSIHPFEWVNKSDHL